MELGTCEGRKVGVFVGDVGVVVGTKVGTRVGLTLYEQQRGVVGDVGQLLEAYGPDTTPGGHIGEQYPAVIIGSVQVKMGADVGTNDGIAVGLVGFIVNVGIAVDGVAVGNVGNMVGFIEGNLEGEMVGASVGLTLYAQHNAVVGPAVGQLLAGYAIDDTPPGQAGEQYPVITAGVG